MIDVVDVLNRLLAWHRDLSRAPDSLWDEVREARDALTGAPAAVTSCPPWSKLATCKHVYGPLVRGVRECTVCKRIALFTPGTEAPKEQHREATDKVPEHQHDYVGRPQSGYICRKCRKVVEAHECEGGYQPLDGECPGAKRVDEPLVTQWYVTVFALHDGAPYSTLVVVNGRSTVDGIIEAAERQCADDHCLNHVPTLAIAAIVVGEHESMI